MVFSLASSVCEVVAATEEDRKLSQFMIVERKIDTLSLSVILRPIDADDDFVRKVAIEYFGEWRGCHLVMDVGGSAESLIDDVYCAQLAEKPIEETPIVCLLKLLFESRCRFVIWHGGDYLNLPTVQSWSEILDVVRAQTLAQPADVYLRFAPSNEATAS
jgi:hypothetical protein